jgi:hypothetical protein
MNARGGEDVGLDQLVERRQHGRAGADMIGQGRDRKLDSLTRIVFALPVERLVVGVFLDQRVSVTSSPIFESLLPPQHGQEVGAG